MTCHDLSSLHPKFLRRPICCGHAARYAVPSVVKRLLLIGILAAGLLSGVLQANLPASAQTSRSEMRLTKTVPGSGEFWYWFESTNGKVSDTKRLPAQGNAVALKVPDLGRGEIHLEVLNAKDGTLAELPVASSAQNLSAEDFKFAQTVKVPVKSGNLPVQGLLVTLQYPDKRVRYLLRPEDNGVAHFTRVPLGQPLPYEITDGTRVETFNLAVNKAAPTAVQDIVLPDDWKVTTVAAAPATGSGQVQPQTQAQPSEASTSNRLVTTLVSIFAVILLIALGLFWLVDSGRMNGLLQKIGITPAQPGASAPMPAFATVGAKASPQAVPAAATAAPVKTTGAPASGPRLVATLGAYSGSIFPLTEAYTNIGREASNAVALTQDSNSSRRHAHIQINNGQYLLVDDGSSNGTYINGVRIASQTPQPLRPGDEVQIGSTRFRFEA